MASSRVVLRRFDSRSRRQVTEERGVTASAGGVSYERGPHRRHDMDKNETVEAKGESEGMTAKGASCAVCGKPRGEWKQRGGRGVEKNGVPCCSEQCAERLDEAR
jgi:hypothetical protein